MKGKAHPDGEDFKVARPSEIGPNAYRIGRTLKTPADRLDGHQIKSAGLPVGREAPVITETLAQRWGNALVPRDRTLFEAKVIATGFLLDFAGALHAVERLDGSKILHGEFLCDRRQIGRRLG